MNEKMKNVENLSALKTLSLLLKSLLKVTEEQLAQGLAEIKCEHDEEIARQKLLADNKYYNDKKTRRLAEYFKEKGYLITKICEVSETSKAKYALAKHILSATDALKPFLRFIYARKNDVYAIDAIEASGKTAICNFCTQLKRMGWLDWTKDKTSITVKRNIPLAEYNFFNGTWAEDATRYMIEKTLHEGAVKSRAVYRGVKLECLDGVRNKDVHEFDVIVEFRDRFYIFETKSGVTLGVGRWIEHASLFDEGKGRSRFIMCCNDDTIDARLFRPYQLLHLNRIGAELSQMLKQEFSATE